MSNGAVRQRSFSAANTLFDALTFLSWLMFFGGIVVFVILGSYSKTPNQLLISLGFSVAISVAGFLFLAMAQIGRAVIHTAETNSEILKVLIEKER